MSHLSNYPSGAENDPSAPWNQEDAPTVKCETCNGTGEVDGENCEDCEGTGEVEEEYEHDDCDEPEYDDREYDRDIND